MKALQKVRDSLKRLIVPIFCALLFALFAPLTRAQDATNFYAAGVSSNISSVAGTALYAHKLVGDTYAFTLIDAVPTAVKPLTVTTSIGAGIAQKLTTVAGVDILVPTAAGISISGGDTGYAWSTGAAGVFHLKNGTFIMPTARVFKSSVGGDGYRPILGVLFGFGK